MKCNCEECGGRGTIQCPECDGQGTQSRNITDIVFDKTHPHFDELVELQKDARRVKEQHDRLVQLNPARQSAYASQYEATQSVIERQAGKILR